MPDERADSPAVEAPGGPVTDGTPATAPEGEAQIAAGADAPEAPAGTPDGAPEIPVVEEPQPVEEPVSEPGAEPHDFEQRWKDTKADRDRLATQMHALQERGVVGEDGSPIEAPAATEPAPAVEPEPRAESRATTEIPDFRTFLTGKSRGFYDGALEDYGLEYGELAAAEARHYLRQMGVLQGGQPAQPAQPAQPEGRYLTPEQFDQHFDNRLRAAQAAGAELAGGLDNLGKQMATRADPGGRAFMDASLTVGNQVMARRDWVAAMCQARRMAPDEVMMRFDKASLMARWREQDDEQRQEELARNGGTPGVGPGGGPPRAGVPSGDVLPTGFRHDPGLDEGPDGPADAPGFD